MLAPGVRNRLGAGFPRMSEHPDLDPDVADLDVDELWLREWAAEGIAALERLLAKHAAFAEFLRRRDEG